MALRALILTLTAAGSATAISKCSSEFNGLLANDPHGDPQAFLRCQGGSGAWSRQLCPGELVFDFVNQQCTTPERKTRQPSTLNIAILNNSCGRGEQCIGGTVCDPLQKKCLCPAGTSPVLETLSCEAKPGVNTLNPYIAKPEVPAAITSIFPNPAVQKFIESFFKPNQNFVAEKSGTDFKPNSNFVLNSLATTIAPTRKMVPPGSTCRDGEICAGGSVCTQPFGMCLCQGNQEARNGECVAPAPAPTLAPIPPQVIKVGLGAICSEPALSCLDEGAACVVGRCSCVAPYIQQAATCALPAVKKEVGPGEPCDEGEICTMGSVCDSVIPVCVCPPTTDLSGGVCVPVMRPAPVPLGPVPNGVPAYLTPTSTASTSTSTATTTTRAPVLETTTPPPPMIQSTLSYKSIPVVPVDVRTTSYTPPTKPVKIQLGGNKQAGVGVACALNTDCMIGAYCNGNTSPATCQCLSTHVNVEGRCEKVIYPGQSGCSAHSQCAAAYTGSTCMDRVCVCPAGARAIEQTCVPANEPVTSPPGGSCSEARTCTGGAVCREGWCVCPEASMIVQKGQCVVSSRTTKPAPIALNTGKKIVPGGACSKPFESCMNGEQCCGGAVCNEFKFCTCPADRPVHMNGECISKVVVIPGGVCDEYSSVCADGTTCINGQCTCPIGSIAVSGKCVALTTQPPTAPVAPLVVPPQAVEPLSSSSPTTSPPHDSARPLAGPLKNCENGEICTGGSSCDAETGICLCPSGQAAFGDRCATPPAFHSLNPLVGATEATVTTTMGAPVPLKGLPQLPTAHEAIRPMIVPVTATATAEPIVTTAATHLYPAATAPPTERPFVLSATIAPRCASDADCGVDRVCAAGGCVCRAGTVESKDGRCEMVQVSRRLKYGSLCRASIDFCDNEAYCLEGVCKCAQGMMLSLRGYCERVVTATSAPRLFTFSWPTTPAPLPTKPLTQRPVPVVTTTTAPRSATTLPLGARCWSDASCQLNAACVQKMCVCAPGYVEQRGNCVENPRATKEGDINRSLKTIGDACYTNAECPLSTDCIEGACACADKHTWKKDRCILTAQLTFGLVPPGSTCNRGEICGGGSMCDSDSKKCICAVGHSIREGRCSSNAAPPFVGPNHSCSKGERCAGGSVCIAGMCACEVDHRAEDGYCRPIEAPNADVTLTGGNGLRFKSKIVNQWPRSTSCDPSRCRLPDCFCTPSGRQPPGGLLPSQVPQFVILTFDDAVNGRTLPDYKRLFGTNRFKNPNGCPIKATFFVSHEWTNYDGVQWIEEGGHELASNSITHVSLSGSSSSRWLSEMDGQRRIMAKFGNSREEKITGMRAPQLAAGGDEMFEMMLRAGFIYDNSIPANGGKGSEPFWPQTMDFKPSFPCNDRPCPTRSYPGVWEIPLNQFYGRFLSQIGAHQRSSMMRAAVPLNASVDELYQMLRHNLARSMDTNRAPLVLTLNADYLQLNEEHSGMQAIERFLESISHEANVFVVTLKQLVDWMREPLPIERIREHPSLRCPLGFASYPSGQQQCAKPNKCIYRTPGMGSPEHQFLTCSPCPDSYPWVTNPTGNP